MPYSHYYYNYLLHNLISLTGKCFDSLMVDFLLCQICMYYLTLEQHIAELPFGQKFSKYIPTLNMHCDISKKKSWYPKKEAHQYPYLSLFRASSLITENSWFIFPAPQLGMMIFVTIGGKSSVTTTQQQRMQSCLSILLFSCSLLSWSLFLFGSRKKQPFGYGLIGPLYHPRESPDHVCRYLRPNG